MNAFLFWLYGWHYLVHNIMTFSIAKVDCGTCQAWEDEDIQRTLETHKRRAPRFGGGEDDPTDTLRS